MLDDSYRTIEALKMNLKIKEAFLKELKLGKLSFYSLDYGTSFKHFERAHIIAQSSPTKHTLVHLWMLRIGIKKWDFREIFGQLFRIPSGFLGSLIGVYPEGNTGGSNVSALRPMEIPEDIKKNIRKKRMI